MNPILLVDDDPLSLESTKKILEIDGFPVETAVNGREALIRLKSQTLPTPILILSDIRMPEMDGMALFRALPNLGLQVPIVLMTAFGNVEDAVFAMKHGAKDFLQKPFKRKDLLEAVRSALLRSQKPVHEAEAFHWGKSPEMERLRRSMDQIAGTDLSVLILGESGTGKERIARAIHDQSHRKDGRWVALNCAALAESLLESELFGHEKGAFTGAVTQKEGLFERAHGGTLFLDEIGDLPLSLQPKLLRVLQDGEVRRVGALESKKVSVRVIAATHRNLHELVTEGRFRADLLFRLEVVTFLVPPLRKRLGDLEELVRDFTLNFSARHGKYAPTWSEDALQLLWAHPWYGNIRELRNAIERAVVFSDHGQILPEHLPPAIGLEEPKSERQGDVAIPIGTSLEEVKEILIQKTLEATEGDKQRAAKLLGIHERTIYRSLGKEKS